jgi:hypothetical protein
MKFIWSSSYGLNFVTRYFFDHLETLSSGQVSAAVESAGSTSGFIPTPLTHLVFIQNGGHVFEHPFNRFGHRHTQGPGNPSQRAG